MSNPAHQAPLPSRTDWRDRWKLVGKINSGVRECLEAYDLTLEDPVALKIVPTGAR
jgi:hypothetical protein